MKKVLLHCSVVLAVLFALSAFAGIEKTLTIEGIISNFDAKQVKLDVNGKTVTVMRNAIPGYYTIKPGNRIIAYISSDTIRKTSKKNKTR